MAIKILIAEDNPAWQRILKEDLLDAFGNNLQIKVVPSFSESLDALNNEFPWNLIIIDLSLPSEPHQQAGLDDPLKFGLRLAERSRDLGIPSIVISITATPWNVRDCFMEYGVSDFIDKRVYQKHKFVDTVEPILFPYIANEEDELQVSPGSFSWLHLTDLHRGMSQQSYLWQNVRQIFFDDLSRLHERSGPWDLVLFTGDLTQRGSKEEFAQVEELLRELWEKLKQLGSSPYLLAVPGNHDLIRPHPEEPTVILLQEWQKREKIKEAFWNDPESPYRKLITQSFENYLKWWTKQAYKPKKDFKVGSLPGDFSCTFEKQDGAKLGVVGLNSSFLQLTDDDYEGKLELHASQFHQACGGDGVTWANQHHVCLLLTHHPPVWLNQRARQDLESEINPYGRFTVHLCGHMHETAYREIAEGGTQTRRTWQGRSLFGLEYIDTARTVERSHGYTVGKVELDGDKGKLSFFPRRAWLQGGQRQIIPEPDVQLIDNWQTVQREFSLLQTYNPN